MKSVDTILDKETESHKRREALNIKVKRIQKTPAKILLRNFLILLFVFALTYLTVTYLYKKIACATVVRYTVGEIDPNFNIGKEELVRLSKEAGENWNKAIGKRVYIYDEDATLRINLVYDERQQERDLLKKNLKELNVNYTSLNDLYAHINSQISAYEKELAEYKSQVNYWNSRGGASRTTFNNLEAWRINLIQKEENVNRLISNFNNSQNNYNLTVENFNQIVEGRKNRIEEEGVYGFENGKPYINIYVYDSVPEMKLLLMHELGHAKAKTHATNKDSIMSTEVSDKQIKLLAPTEEDLLLMQSCRFEI